MSSNKSGEFGAFIVGFFVGGLVGAATALLMAPQSGEETRALIQEKGIELKDKANMATEDALARAEAAKAEALAHAEAMRAKAEEALASIQKAHADALEDIEDAADDAIEDIEEADAD
ncbi:MAG TPA: YtxH domain-containing protein [Anaerolineales bacterium]|nr:YtxH domain-containing protein [Anaerolineales bacterium]